MNRLILLLASFCIFLCPAQQDWPAYNGSQESTHYSRLNQIHTGNVQNLRVAWQWDSGDSFRDSEMQCNPLIIGGVLYATTPMLRVVALNAATGKLIWSFDPNPPGASRYKRRNRGLNFWDDGAGGRIYFGSGSHLFAISARTGKAVAEFGTGGKVDLREGLGRDPQSLTVTLTTPGVIYQNLLIVGSLVSEGLPSAPGHIRAYDLKTGALRWTFRTIPQPGEFGYETWPRDGWTYLGGANNWAGMSLDAKRGTVFIPTGSAAFDFYGANRVGDNLFANTLLALDAATGKRKWHFQFVKHDVWDRDFPAPPTLVTVRRDGKEIDALAQITKSGHILVLDRDTGKPLFPMEERAVPASDVDGEVLAKTQVLPLKPAPFARQTLGEADLTQRTPEAHAAVLAQLQKIRSNGQFTPPSKEGTIIFPGFDGGGEWGGSAFDPETGLLYVNSNEMAWILRLVAKKPRSGQPTGASLYQQNCASCHREDRRGTPPEFPALDALAGRRTEAELLQVIRAGRGRMPGFRHLGEGGTAAIARHLLTGERVPVLGGVNSPAGLQLPYDHDGYNKFLDPEGYPAVSPPWGTLNAVSLNTGEYAWKIPFGEHPQLAATGLKDTGSENYGGAVVTAGGLLFIGATNFDRKFRAFDKLTGKLLWETTLPASGNATPATYSVNGRQYVVIAAGGGKSGAPSGGSYVAFALPE